MLESEMQMRKCGIRKKIKECGLIRFFCRILRENPNANAGRKFVALSSLFRRIYLIIKFKRKRYSFYKQNILPNRNISIFMNNPSMLKVEQQFKKHKPWNTIIPVTFSCHAKTVELLPLLASYWAVMLLVPKNFGNIFRGTS